LRIYRFPVLLKFSSAQNMKTRASATGMKIRKLGLKSGMGWLFPAFRDLAGGYSMRLRREAVNLYRRYPHR
jgi:hypothetical protein